LKVANLERSLAFYRELLGFELIAMYGDQAAFISAGGYHHHIGLNTWHSKNAPPAPLDGVDCFIPLYSIPPGETWPLFTTGYERLSIH
jgi:catechol 2,3-dioxygenase